MSKRLLKTTSIFASVTLVARTLGFVRDTIIAQLFGASAAVDAFYIAFRILTSLRSFVENPLSQVFVPVLSEYREKYSQQRVKYLIASTAGTIGFTLALVIAFCILTTPYWLKVVVPGVEAYRFELTIYFLRIIFPYLLCIALCALGVAVMNVYGKFWVVALTPIWVSIVLINTALWMSKYFAVNIEAQAWGIVFAGCVQVLFILTFLKQLNLLTWPRINWKESGVQKTVKLMLPALLGASANQIGMLINTNIASFLAIGTISRLYYADRLVYFPMSVIGVSLSIAVLSPLAKYYVAGDEAQFNKTLGWGLRCNVLVAIPAAIIMAMLAGPLVVSLFAYGKFSTFDVIQTQRALLGYAIGVPAFMMAKTLVSAFYARQDTNTLFKVVLWVAPINAMLGLLLVPWLKLTGITLASSLATWVQIILLMRKLNRPLSILLKPAQGWNRWIISMGGMIVGLIIFLYFANPVLEVWLAWDWLHRLIRLSLLGAGAFFISSMAFMYGNQVSLKQSFLEKTNE